MFPMTSFKTAGSLLLAFLLSGCIEFYAVPQPDRGVVIPDVNSTLLQLIDTQERYELLAEDYASTSLGTLITLGTPAGVRLRLRYNQLGVPLVEALKAARDEQMLDRLFEFARWSNKPKVRAESLVTIASFSDPADLDYFRTALSDDDIGIRFAAIEALQRWGREGALELLREAMQDGWSPLLQVFAAQAALSLGDETGLPVLYKGLDERSWIIRAMSAQYLGKYAPASDYERLFRIFIQERENDFVAAELAIAVLSLLSRSKESDSVTRGGVSKGWKEGKEVPYTIAADNVVEMEPLILVPPRLGIPRSQQIGQNINNKLLELIKALLDEPVNLKKEEDPNVQNLNQMLTPAGFALQTRYSYLSVLVAAGLGGTEDVFLRSELSRLAEGHRNSLTRATALLSLSYSGKKEDLVLVSAALASEDPIIRFGAMEAVLAGRFKEVLPDITSIALTDPVPAFRSYAMKVLLNFRDPGAQEVLIASLDDPDWPARAMKIWYLGRYGTPDDYSLVLSKMTTEENPFVLAELSLAALRLAPL